MNGFRSMGTDVVLPSGAPLDEVHALFDERDRRFSRFIPSSELNRVNASPFGATAVSEELASMLSLSLDVARATGGLVTPAVGGAFLAAGYDRDFTLPPVTESRHCRRRSLPWTRSSSAGGSSCAPCR